MIGNYDSFHNWLSVFNHTFSRIPPLVHCTGFKKYAHKNPSSIHQISNKYRYLCSQPSQQKDFIQKKQTRDLGYIESTNKLKKAPNSSVRSWRNSSQNLNHYSTTNLAPKPGQGPHGHSTWTIGLQSVDTQ